jgi:cyclic-di-GMP-binding protein
MAKDSSFDIVSEVDLQDVDDGVNTARKEITNRYDLKDQAIEISFDRQGGVITVQAPSDFHLDMVRKILLQKLGKRGIDPKSVQAGEVDKAGGDTVRQANPLVQGLDKELAKSIVKDIKGLKHKVQASVQDDRVRVSGAKKDDLQAVMTFLKGNEYPVPLQFVNYR